jgi:Protein of unknown function (DUF3617)
LAAAGLFTPELPAHSDAGGSPARRAYTAAMRQTSWPLRALLGAATACCLIAGSSLLYAADRMLPGQWEFTTTTEGDPHVFAHCMSTEDAGQVNGDSKSGKLAAEKKAEGRCTVESFAAAGNSVEYTLVCGSRTIKSATVFHGDSSEGTLTTTVDGKVVTSQVKARRLGACP